MNLKKPMTAVLMTALAWATFAGGGRAGKGAAVAEDKQLEGVVRAPEFPEGMEWLNTARPLSLSQLRGRFVLLDFWTFCCINCMHIIPDLKRLEEKYGDALVVIGVHSAKFKNEQGTEAIRKAVLRYGIGHPVVNDKDFKIWNEYGARAWPTLVLLNPNGRIIGQFSGEGIFEPFDRVLEKGVPYFKAKGELREGPLGFAAEATKPPPTVLSFPGKVSADEKGGRLFITDSDHNRVIVTDASGAILDVIGGGGEGRADGPFASATFHHPQGTAFSGDTLYIADTENHSIRAANLTTRRVTTLWGTGEQADFGAKGGKGTAAALNSPWDLTMLAGKVYVAMAGAHQIWVGDPATGVIAPFAGSGREARIDGPMDSSALAQTSGITTDGVNLYFADSETSSIREATTGAKGRIRTIVGEDLFVFGDVDGSHWKARLQHPLGVCWHDGILYVADTYNNKIKKVDPEKRTSETYAGTGQHGSADGALLSTSFDEPGGLCFLKGKLYVADTNNHAVRVIDPEAGRVTTLMLAGLDKLMEGKKSGFSGRKVDVPPLKLKAGDVRLRVNLKLPRGGKLNPESPAFLSWRTSDAEILRVEREGDSMDVKPNALPSDLPLPVSSGKAVLTFDAVIYYCRENSGACYFDDVTVDVPVEVGPKGADEPGITIDVK